METILYITVLAALLGANMLIASWLGWLLTEWKRPFFNVKPFNCRPCLTFWLTLLLGAPLPIVYDEAALAVVAVLVCIALINFIIIHSKIQIDE